jgi:ribosomal-protein-alanine N-acetyltransferase
MNKIKLTYRRITISDIPALIDLEEAIFPCPWTYEMFEHEVYSDYSNFFIAFDPAGEPAGYFGLWLIVDEGHINNFAVTEKYRGKGVSDDMMKKIFSMGKDADLNVYYLEARKSNVWAIELYKRHGFFEAGLRKNYYREPVEDAILMVKKV